MPEVLQVHSLINVGETILAFSMTLESAGFSTHVTKMSHVPSSFSPETEISASLAPIPCASKDNTSTSSPWFSK